MKRVIMSAFAAALILCLSGCARMLERDYTYVEKHYEQYVEEPDSSVLVVKNYIGLKSALLYLIEEHAEYGVIRAYDYSGEVSNDFTEVCLSVKQSTPLGAYAVDYISHEKVSIVSYTELHIYITYRRTAEQIKSITSLSADTLSEEVGNALREYNEYLVYQLSYFTNDEQYVRSLIEKLADDLYFPMRPVFKITLYPESGVQRIIEIEVEYPGGRELFIERAEQLESVRADIISALDPGDNADKQYLQILTKLNQRADYDYETQERLMSESFEAGYESGAYGALFDGAAVSQGYAEAFYQLCAQAGLPCIIVSGTRAEQSWYWNMVELEAGWYHVDAASADIEGSSERLFMSDEEMAYYCQWSRSAYYESGTRQNTYETGMPDGE